MFLQCTESASSSCIFTLFEAMWTKGTRITVRWKMQTDDRSLFDEAVQWDHLFERSPTNSTETFVRRHAELVTLTGYFHDFSTSGRTSHAVAVILSCESLKISSLPLCKWLHCQFHGIVHWPRSDLAQHCSRPASACLRFSRVSLTLAQVTLVQLSWPNATITLLGRLA